MPQCVAESALDSVEVYTDGGCDPNPGPGGWAAILSWQGQAKELSGASRQTTNNRMELTAAIEALRALQRPCRVELHTDSQYLRRGITQWVAGWQSRGWKKADGQPVENRDLWEALLQAAKPHGVSWHWTRGHNGDPLNERADRLATIARRRMLSGSLQPTPEPALAASAPSPDGATVCARACALGSPGPGGHGAIVTDAQGARRAVAGGRERTTSNAMELEAVLAGLRALPDGSRVAVYTASQYVLHGAKTGLSAWEPRGWRTAEGKPVSHLEMWQRLQAEMSRLHVTWHPLAEADAGEAQEALRLARQEAERIKKG